MRDTFNIPTNTRTFVSEWVGFATATGASWQVWQRPPGVTMLAMLCIGGGAGGGGGAGNTAGAAKGGGGGGGSSGIARLLIDANVLPETLYISAGVGGNGGAGGSSGNGTAGSTVQAAINSMIAVYPNSAAQNLVLTPNVTVPGGGGAGTTAAAGGAGTAGTLASSANCPAAQFGIHAFVAGVVGTAGGAQTGAVGAAGVNNPTGSLILSGCGGAGSTAADFAGGGYAALANTDYIGNPGGAAGGNAGSQGHKAGRLLPLWYGGCGGGASNSTTGGAGGYGFCFGAGGGGGGGGTTIGGRGGDGGPGFVRIIAW